jgi:hypothetical protein
LPSIRTSKNTSTLRPASRASRSSISGKMFGSTPSIFTVIGAPQVKRVSAAGAANIHRPAAKPRSASTHPVVSIRLVQNIRMSLASRDWGDRSWDRMKRCDVALWPVASHFTLGPDVSFRGESEVSWVAEFAPSVENEPRPCVARGLRRVGGERSCINVSGFCLERWLLAIMDISARAISLSDRPRPGQLGHQCSQTPERPNLHLVSSSHRPRQVAVNSSCRLSG